MLRHRLAAACVPIFAALSLASCGQGPVLAAHDAVVKLNPIEGNPSALYFTVHGGPQATTLEDVLSPSAIRVAMHDNVRDPATGMVSMKPLVRVPIPADTDVRFAPGGKHVMLYGINLPARRLNEIDLTFVFGNGERVAVTASMQGMGDGGGDMDMSNMDMSGGDDGGTAGAPAPASVPTRATPGNEPAQPKPAPAG